MPRAVKESIRLKATPCVINGNRLPSADSCFSGGVWRACAGSH